MGPADCSEFRAMLAAFEELYSGLCFLRSMRSDDRRGIYYFGRLAWDVPSTQRPVIREIVSRSIDYDQLLVLDRVQFGSPGYLDFIGDILSLRQIRGWLSDRHEREKDRLYRSPAEEVWLDGQNEGQRLANDRVRMENAAHRVRLVGEAYSTLDELPIAESLKNLLLAEIIDGPVRALERAQDIGLIDMALELPPQRPES